MAGIPTIPLDLFIDYTVNDIQKYKTFKIPDSVNIIQFSKEVVTLKDLHIFNDNITDTIFTLILKDGYADTLNLEYILGKFTLKSKSSLNFTNGVFQTVNSSISHIINIDETDSENIYIGKAEIESTNNQAVWQIKKLIIVGLETDIRFAEGTDSFDKVWDDRASYTYS